MACLHAVRRRPVSFQRPRSSSASRFTAGTFGFLTFTQCCRNGGQWTADFARYHTESKRRAGHCGWRSGATEAAAQQDLASISYICRRALVNELKSRGLLEKIA
jgi:hypothetical protein